jgi:hypothetical protein
MHKLKTRFASLNRHEFGATVVAALVEYGSADERQVYSVLSFVAVCVNL